MIVRDINGTNTQKIAQWWVRIQRYTALSYHLSNQDFRDLSRNHDIESSIYKLNTHFKAVEMIPYPQEANRVRQASLAFLMSMITIMQQAGRGTFQERKTIFNIALNNRNILASCLEEFNLSM